MTLEETQPDAKPPLNDSLFHLWRCLVAIILADGVYHPTERKFLDKAISALDNAYAVSIDHRKAFFEDFKNAQSIEQLLTHVTDPLHRATLPYFGQFISLIDGQQGQTEKAFVKKIEDLVKSPEVDAIHAELQKEIAAKKAESTRHFQLVDFLLGKLGIGRLE